jgi:hypothetical protein
VCCALSLKLRLCHLKAGGQQCHISTRSLQHSSGKRTGRCMRVMWKACRALLYLSTYGCLWESRLLCVLTSDRLQRP